MTKQKSMLGKLLMMSRLTPRQPTVQIYFRFYIKWNMEELVFCKFWAKNILSSINHGYADLEIPFKTTCLCDQTHWCGYSQLHSINENLAHKRYCQIRTINGVYLQSMKLMCWWLPDRLSGLTTFLAVM